MGHQTFNRIFTDHCLNPSNNIYVSLNGIGNNFVSPYEVHSKFYTYNFTVIVPPKSTIKALDLVYVINLIRNVDENPGIEFYSDTKKYTNGDAYWYNELAPIYIYNSNDTAKTVSFGLYTKSYINESGVAAT
jgi:hypothetical protein